MLIARPCAFFGTDQILDQLCIVSTLKFRYFFLETPGGINTVKQSTLTPHSSPSDSAPRNVLKDGVKNHFPNERKKDAASLAIRTVHSTIQQSRNAPSKMSATVYVDWFICSLVLLLTHDKVFKSPSNIDVCHPVALSHMARAINKYITSTTSLGNHSLESVSSASGTWETLESYISRIILACQVPNIVAYTSLYLLMTISRSCSCKCTDDFLESPKPKPPPLSHQISQALSRSAISRVQKSHWVGHHFFMGPFLLVLRSYERISGRDVISHELLSFVSGLSANDLKDLESSIDRAMGTSTKLTIQEMIKQRDFRSLRETECPYITTRRMREARRTSLEKRRAELLDSTRRENERSVPILCFFPWRINALAFSGISPWPHPMTAKMKRKTKQKMNRIDAP